jgi:hypothetical protein
MTEQANPEQANPEQAAGSPAPAAGYVAAHVQIGGGFGGMKPLAQNGTVTIADGKLTLIGTDGQQIDQAPVGQVSAKRAWYTMNSVVYVRWGEKKYSLGLRIGGGMLFAGNLRLLVGSRASKQFCTALAEAQQGAGPAPVS